MSTCSTCNCLRVDEITNESPEETNWPGPERLKTFVLYVPVQTWASSANAGCTTCNLIWDALLHFDRDLVLSIVGGPAAQHDDEPVHVYVDGKLGQTLTVTLSPLPPGKQFPGVELYTSQLTGSPTSYPIIGTASHLSPALGLDRCLELCRPWIETCQQLHPQCMTQGSQRLPTRVLDLGDIDGGPAEVCLYEPPAGSTASYVTLSYCWGNVGNLTTTSSSIVQRKAGISWSLLPNLFRDAILVTRSLGMRYLWIDSLCIIQDSPSDWEQEAARMADVYENAFLTIAAESARNPTHSILTPRHTEWVSTADTMFPSDKRRSKRRRYSVLDMTMKIPDDAQDKDCTIHVREPLLHNDILLPRSHHDITYQLLSRAWTLQERLLARRTLHFTAFELIWECKETLFCECGTIAREFAGLNGDHSPKVAYERALVRKSGEKSDDDGDDTLRGKVAATNLHHPRWKESTKTWTLLVGGYSTRRLSYVTDKLPAISGVARRFHRQETNKSNYLAGLWRQDLPWLLCWRAFQWRFEQRTVEYCAPTWSWASMTSPVIWDNAIYEAVSKVEIVDAVTIPQGIDIFGKVSGGSISLRGCLQWATLDFEVVVSTNVLGLKNEKGDKIFFVPDQNTPGIGREFDEQYPHDPPSKALQRTAFSLLHGDSVACLWVLQNTETATVYGLVLAPPAEKSLRRSVPESDPGCMVYERVGLITAMSRAYQKDEISALLWFAGSKEEIITVI